MRKGFVGSRRGRRRLRLRLTGRWAGRAGLAGGFAACLALALSLLLAVPQKGLGADAAAGAASVAGRPAGPEQTGAREPTLVDAYIKARRGAVRPAEPFRLFPDGSYPQVARRKQEVGAITRNCFVFRRSGCIEAEVAPRPGDRMMCAMAAQFPVGAVPVAPVFLTVRLRTAAGEQVLCRRAQNPVPGLTPMWNLVEADLAPAAGSKAALVFDVTIEKEGTDAGSGTALFLADPVVARPRRDGRPNIILCILDATRRDHVSVYGYGRRTTPFLEELAGESVVFEDAYSQSCWTRPSVASILSGLYPSQHGAGTMFERLDDAVVTFPEVLRAAGYSTAGFVAIRPAGSPAFNYDQGYDLYFGRGAAGTRLAEDASGWIAAEAQEPFFLMLHMLDPHEPHNTPKGRRDEFGADYAGPVGALPRFTDRALAALDLTERDKEYLVARYDAAILSADDAVRGLVESLRVGGLWGNTLLIVTADHGEELGEHGHWGHQGNLYPEKLRVPLMVKLPDGAHGGRRVKGLVSGVDLMPTMLAAAGLPIPACLEGVDLLKEGAATGQTGRQRHFAEYSGLLDRDREHLGVVDGRYEYILARDAAGRVSEYLFDLSADPLGLRNVAAELPEVRMRLAGLIAARYGFAGYTIAVNGGSVPAAFSGTVRSEARIVQAEGLRTEEGDTFETAADGRSLRFALNVAGDDDVLRFETEPANAAVSIELMLDGTAAPAELVHLGPLAARCDGLPLAISSQRCAVDADLSEARKYGVGKELGVYIWRVGTPRVGAGEAKPDEETLRALKNLGYL